MDVFITAVGSCVQLESTASFGENDPLTHMDHTNKLEKQKVKQLTRIESVDGASFSVTIGLLEEVRERCVNNL